MRKQTNKQTNKQNDLPSPLTFSYAPINGQSQESRCLYNKLCIGW